MQGKFYHVKKGKNILKCTVIFHLTSDKQFLKNAMGDYYKIISFEKNIYNLKFQNNNFLFVV